MSDLCPVAVGQDLLEDEHQPETAGESHLLLLKQKIYCDVTFTFPNHPEGIGAHELYLKARSPVFAKIFRMRKSGNVQGDEIRISDTAPDVFQQFLEFIYADKLEVDIARALDLLQLSQKYKVRPLTKKCEELLETEVPIVDSVKVFEAARRYGRWELMDRAGHIMVKSFLKLIRTGALANAEEETFIYLLSFDDLIVKEVELFEIILKWGKTKVGPTADKELLRSKLKNLTSKIRFTFMAPEEFTKVVVPTGLLSAEETISIYSYFCGDEVTRRDLKIKFDTTCRKLDKGLTSTFSKLAMSAGKAGDLDSVVSSSSASYSAPFKAAYAGGTRPFQTTACKVVYHPGNPMQQAVYEKRTKIFPKPPAIKGNVDRRSGSLKDTRGAVGGRYQLYDPFIQARVDSRVWRDDRPNRGQASRDPRSNTDSRDQVNRSGMNGCLDRRGGPSGSSKEKGSNTSSMNRAGFDADNDGECFETNGHGLDSDPFDYYYDDDYE